jgi:hypothetical protein
MDVDFLCIAYSFAVSFKFVTMKLSGLIPPLLVWVFVFTRALEQWPL